MAVPPPCSSLGAHCHSLRVTLRIGALEEGEESLDHEATWLLGHTQHITFGELWSGEEDLYVDATLHVPCRFYEEQDGRARCRAHGFDGPAPARPRRPPQPRRLGPDQFRIVEGARTVDRTLPPARRGLPVLLEANPCLDAPCRTSDHVRGAACCRDLQVEIMCTRRQRRLEALVRSRKPPYLCKVERPGDFSLEAEMISACGYLGEGGVECTLHGRRRRDGRPAKPDLCTDWPEDVEGLHPGCIFAVRNGRRQRSP